jgi:AcrR family transcriptional regulator
MKKNKEKENITNCTREDIIYVASILFSEYTYLGVSMSDIAQKVNITKAGLYYHFKNKAEIYKKVLDKAFCELELSIRKAFNERTIAKKLFELIKNYLDFNFKEKNLIKTLMLKQSPSSSEVNKYIVKLRERVINLIQPLVEEVLLNKKISQETSGSLLTSLLIGMMDGLLLEYSLLNKKIDSEKLSRQIINILF